MTVKFILAGLLALYLANCANAQAVQITIPANSNISWVPSGVPCTSYNVGIVLQYRSISQAVNFLTFDNLYSTCYPAVLPQPYAALSTGATLFSSTQMGAYVDNPNLCLSFVNLGSVPTVVIYQLTFICKVSLSHETQSSPAVLV